MKAVKIGYTKAGEKHRESPLASVGKPGNLTQDSKIRNA